MIIMIRKVIYGFSGRSDESVLLTFSHFLSLSLSLSLFLSLVQYMYIYICIYIYIEHLRWLSRLLHHLLPIHQVEFGSGCD